MNFCVKSSSVNISFGQEVWLLGASSLAKVSLDRDISKDVKVFLGHIFFLFCHMNLSLLHVQHIRQQGWFFHVGDPNLINVYVV